MLILTGTTTLQTNKIIDELLAKEFSISTRKNLPGDHVAVYKNAELFSGMLKRFLAEKSQNSFDNK